MNESEEKNIIQQENSEVAVNENVETPTEEVPETPAETVPEVPEKPKKKRKHRLLKTLLIVLGSLVALFFLITILISPVAHWYIEKHSKDLCGRVVTMDDLKVNILKGSVEIKGLVGFEKNDKDTCLAFDRLYVDMSLWKLLKKTVQLNEITLETPYIVIVQYPGRFNFTDIAEFYEDDEDDDDDEKSTWVVDLRNISISKGNVIYRDASVNSKFDLRQLAAQIPQIYFSTEQTDLGLDLKFANGGGLNVKLLYGMKNSEYDLSLKLTDFELDAITPYLKQFMNIQDFSGEVTANLNLKGNIEHILDVAGTGNAKFANLSLTDKQGRNLAKVHSVDVGILEANTKTDNYHLNKFIVSGLDFNYEVYPTYATFDSLFVDNESDAPADTTTVKKDTAAAESSSWHLLVDELAVENSAMCYRDHTMRQLVEVPITNIDIRSNNFDMDKPIALKVNALVGDGGELRADWAGSLSNFSNMKLMASLKNFQLTLASPYSVEYLAYPITDGVLSFVSINTLENNIISSQNKVDIYNCQMDKKLKDFKPEYNIPMRAAVYILTDRKGNIQLDLPVSGNISDPTFSYKKIIFKTLCNLFVKVVASPIDFLVKAIGGEPDLFADIVYDIHPQGLGSESSDKLNKIAAAMKEKSEIKLSIQQSVDIEENMREYALFNAKREYYVQKHPGQLKMEDFENIQKVKVTNPDFVSYVNGRAGDATGDIYAKCLSLYNSETIRQQIDANIERRNQQIVNHLVTQGISSSRLKVLPLGDKKTPKGKTLVSFNVEMDEE